MRFQKHIIISILLVLVILGVTQIVTFGASTTTSSSAPEVGSALSSGRDSSWLTVAADKTSVTTGSVVTFSIRVTNRAAETLAGRFTGNTDYQYIYDQDQCWALKDGSGNLKFPKSTGHARVIAGYDNWDTSYATNTNDCSVTSTIDHPWRWSVGTALSQNGTRLIKGRVRFTVPGTYTIHFGLARDYIGYPSAAAASCNNTGDPDTHVCFADDVTITVTDPTSTPTVTRTEINSRERVARLDFDQAIGQTTQFLNSIARNHFVCPGTLSSPSASCPDITATGIYSTNAVSFAGAQSIRSIKRLSIGQQTTFSFWAKPTFGSEMIAFAAGVTGKDIKLGFDASGKFFCESVGERLTASSGVSGTEWDHYACTFNTRTGDRNVYVNSDFRGSDVITNRRITGAAFAYLGSDVDQSSGMYSGEIDEVVIYRSDFSIDNIEWLYNHFNDPNETPSRISPTRTETATSTSTSTPFPTDVLRRAWAARFTYEDSGSLTFVNADDARNPAICTRVGSCPTAAAPGIRYGRGITFNGSQSLMLSRATNITNRQSFAANLWFNASTIGSEQVMLSMRRYTDITDPVFLMGLKSSGEPFCSYNGVEIAGANAITTSTWYSLNCAIDNRTKNVVLYLNGYPIDSGTFTALPNGQMQMWIGENGHTAQNGFNGSIDEVALLNQTVNWDVAEVLYDQYAEPSKRSPTRTRTLSPTRTPSLTKSPTRTRTPTRTKTLTPSATSESYGPYPYPIPVSTATKTNTPTRTNTPTATATPTGTINPTATSFIVYPYP